MKIVWILSLPIAAAAASPLYTKQLANDLVDAGVVSANQMFAKEAMPVSLETLGQEGSLYSTRYVQRLKIVENDSELCIDLITKMDLNPLHLVSGNFAKSITQLAPIQAQDPDCGFQNTLFKDEQLRTAYDKYYGESGPVEVSANYGFSGATNGSYLIHGFKIDAADNADKLSIDIGSLDGDYTMSSDLSEVSYQGKWSGLEFMHPEDGKLAVGDVSFEADQSISGIDDFWLGSASFTVSDIELIGDQTVLVKMMNFSSSADIQEDMFLSSMAYEVEDINVDGRPVGNLDLDLSASGIKSEDLTAMSDVLQEMQARESQGLDVTAQEKQLTNLFMSMASKVNLNIDKLRFYLEDASALVSGSVNMSDIGEFTVEELTQQPELLVSTLAIDLNALLDQKLVKQVAKQFVIMNGHGASVSDIDVQTDVVYHQWLTMLSMFVEQGFLTLDEGKAQYTTKVSMDKGALMVNGAPMSLPM